MLKKVFILIIAGIVCIFYTVSVSVIKESKQTCSNIDDTLVVMIKDKLNKNQSFQDSNNLYSNKW